MNTNTNNKQFSYSYQNTSYNYTDSSYSYQNTSYNYTDNSYSYKNTSYKYTKNQTKTANTYNNTRNTFTTSTPYNKTQKNYSYATTETKKQDETRLIQKIFRFLSYQEKKQIKFIIDSVNINQTNLQDALLHISSIVTPIMTIQNIKRDEDRQNWIANQILTYITNTLNVQPTENLKIVDIGGGNGNVLREINASMQSKYNITTKPENFICVETQSDWVESYKFDNETINYSFWNNEIIPIESNSIDIVLCMVSLHHMNDATIQTTISEIKRILKPGGHILIKEHDADTANALNFIEWEHHLYHILDKGYERIIVNPETYLEEHIDNFKAKAFWKNHFQTNGFKYIETTNRCLESGTESTIYDSNNVTNLYWEIYKK